MKRHVLILLASLALAACGTSVPEDSVDVDALPPIYPDYADVTIPVNIAPLTFLLDDTLGQATDMIARYSHGNAEIVCSGKMQPAPGDWRALTAQAVGDAIQVDVYARHGDRWQHYRPFRLFVSPDSIDPYLSYRLIPPSFVSYESLTISQRCLEDYDESVIYDNMLCGHEATGQCINCHSYQQYNPRRMQFHARQSHGGTVIAYDGHLEKVNMRNDSLLSAGVYPAWHPWLPLIVYSTDLTHQSFHTTDLNKVEVFDTESDIIAYDVTRGEVTNLENDSSEFEVFPAWAPDGRTLYYCSAHFDRQDSAVSKGVEVVQRATDLRYNIYSKTFDPAVRQFGPRQPVFIADTLGLSATLPRVSPDGRFLLFTVGSYGYFHIWHHDADLWLLDLATGEARPLDEVNSADTESYHSWSANGRWVVFSSRRDDGNYTRPFFAHCRPDGTFDRPFELPTADPDYHRQLLRCYNIPEFMSGRVDISPQTFADLLKGEGRTVKYVRQLTP